MQDGLLNPASTMPNEISHLTLVLGGARSGKSRHAEALIEACPAPWSYIATAQAYDDEMCARIAEHPQILDHWFSASAATRARLDAALDVAYGDAPSETLDVFRPKQPGAPVLVYIHGGYWRALDKRDQSFVAAPFVEAGATRIGASVGVKIAQEAAGKNPAFASPSAY